MHSTYLKILPLIFWTMLVASEALGKATYNSWVSATHFGFATQDVSSTGFARATGSYFGFSVVRQLHERLGVGLKTLGLGATEEDHRQYRLTTAAVVQVKVWRNWFISLAAGIFKEQGQDQDAQTTYRSHGKLIEIAWHRFFELRKNLNLGWGGFYEQHWGDLDLNRDTAANLSPALRQSSTNLGSSHGVEFLLSFTL